jgi:uncharacterized protein YceK
MRFISLLLLIVLLSGCETLGKRERTPPDAPETVNKAVAVSCVERWPVKPVIHTDAELKKMTDAEFITAVHADRLKLRDYKEQMEAATSGCD